jgi:hypothetical protein
MALSSLPKSDFKPQNSLEPPHSKQKESLRQKVILLAYFRWCYQSFLMSRKAVLASSYQNGRRFTTHISMQYSRIILLTTFSGLLAVIVLANPHISKIILSFHFSSRKPKFEMSIANSTGRNNSSRTTYFISFKSRAVDFK